MEKKFAAYVVINESGEPFKEAAFETLGEAEDWLNHLPVLFGKIDISQATIVPCVVSYFLP